MDKFRRLVQCLCIVLTFFEHKKKKSRKTRSTRRVKQKSLVHGMPMVMVMHIDRCELVNKELRCFYFLQSAIGSTGLEIDSGNETCWSEVNAVQLCIIWANEIEQNKLDVRSLNRSSKKDVTNHDCFSSKFRSKIIKIRCFWATIWFWLCSFVPSDDSFDKEWQNLTSTIYAPIEPFGSNMFDIIKVELMRWKISMS